MNRRQLLQAGATPFALPAFAWAGRSKTTEAPLGMVNRTAIQKVCAWPNLTVLGDGTLAVAIYNRPVHGRWHGDVEIWAST